MSKPALSTLAVLALACGACSAEPPLAFPANSALEVTIISGDGEPKRWSISPPDPRYTQMHEWLARNQSGWSAYLATQPGRGILVSAGELHIQFLGASAFACRSGASCLQKRIQEAEYGFLVK